MYPNLRITLHCFGLSSLIGNTPFSVPRLFKSLHVWRPFVLSLTIGIFRALISPVLLRCGMLCSGKHDYGQLCLLSPPPDTAYGNIHTLALIDHAPPRFPDSRVREISIDVKMTGA
jgi:hypothetical protein